MKESKVITFIGGFYIFGGIIVLLSLIFNGSGLNMIFGLPNIPDYIVKLLVGIIYIPLGYLYINRIKNSNWIVLALAIIFFCISASLTTEFNAQPFIGNYKPWNGRGCQLQGQPESKDWPYSTK